MASARRRQSKIPPFSRVMRNAKRIINEVAKDELSKFATEMRGYLVNGILAQRFASLKQIPLSRYWSDAKREHGLDPRVLIATKTYVNHIQVIRHSPTNYEVNVPAGVYALDINRERADITLRQLAGILEFGSEARGVPGRAHWRIAFEEASKRAPAVAARIGEKSTKLINRQLSRG